LPGVRKLDAAAFSFLCALQSGRTLGDAMSAASVDGDDLTRLLAMLFEEGLVGSVG
jgi:hypothetical protein